MGKERIDYLSFIRDGKELGGVAEGKTGGKAESAYHHGTADFHPHAVY